MTTPAKPKKESTRTGVTDDVDAIPRRRGSVVAFPVVGVGASAGGLDAFRQLLAHVPADSGLAFVLVQHLEATRTSLLSDALSQSTTMKVAQAEDGVRVEPNRVYVIPPGAQMGIEEGLLKLVPMSEDERRPHLPIDYFFRSLAAERGRQAIGVVLSGTASDGTDGLRAIRANGGITFAQDPSTARFGEMPQHAIDAGVVDFSLALAALGAELALLARHPYLTLSEPVPPTPAGAAFLAKVLTVLRTTTGVDFEGYKSATLLRRIARRMAIRKVQGIAGYLEVLRHDPAEVPSLYEDLLIKVTSFFRDPASFDDLKSIALPEILKHKPADQPIRAWVVGCASGEEVYSLAMSLLEHLGNGNLTYPILIFGSDISEKALVEARAGHYPDAAVLGLGEERLKRFFVRTARGWRVSQAVRELCVFVRHDVTRDPPFSRIDLLSCRNVLIYFGQALQRRVLAAAHYSLNQPGYLLLGRSESASGVPRWFAPVGGDGRLFLRRLGPSTFRFAGRAGAYPPATRPLAATSPGPPRSDDALARHVDELMLARYAPPGVIVNERLEVIQFRGRTGPYLETPPGAPQNQLLKMASAGLASPLRLALTTALKTSAPVRKERVAFESGGPGRSCDLVVFPLAVTDGGERTFAVLFEERPAPVAVAPAARRGATSLSPEARRELEEELVATREQVAALLEEHSRSTDVLTSGNDDLVSSNEELQCLNEELETAKEEVQSSNEELATVNDELHDRNQELERVGADVLNLLDAVEIPIVMLDGSHRISRFTRMASTTLGLTPADVGKAIGDVTLPIQAPDLESWIARAVDQAILVEAEVRDDADRWHRLQIRPRRNAGGQADGAILSLVDIDDLHGEVVMARWARDYARSIVAAVQVPLVVLDSGLQVLSANAAFDRMVQAEPAATEGHAFFDLDAGRWDQAGLRQVVTAALETGGDFPVQELEREFPGTGPRATAVTGRVVASPTGDPMIVLGFEDITERRYADRRRAELRAYAEGLLLTSLSHQLRAPLEAIMIQARRLQGDPLTPAETAGVGASLEAETRLQVRLVDDLFDMSRIVAGTLDLAFEPVDVPALVLEAVEAARPDAEAGSVGLSVVSDGEHPSCRGDPVRLRQVVANLLGNAVKFTPSGGRVAVRVDAVDGCPRLTVTDTGRGIDPAFLPRVFDRFAREEAPSPDSPGLGLGLAFVQDLVALHGGSVQAASPGRGLGSTFTVLLPGQVVPVATA